MDHWGFVFLAYGIVWLAIGIYIAILWDRLRRAEAELTLSRGSDCSDHEEN